MNRPVSIILLVVGIILVIYGISSSHSISSNVSQAVTGTPTDHTMWLLIGGVVVGLIGLVGMFRGGSRS